MNKKLSNLLRWIIGISIFLLLILKIGPKNIGSTLSSFNLIYLFPILAIYAISFILGTFNIKLLLDCTSKGLRYIQLLRYHILSWSFGLISPGKIGEFSLVYFLKKKGVEIGQGTLVVILDKLISVIVLSILSVVGFFIFFTKIQALRLVILTVVMLAIVIFFIFTSKGRYLIKRLILRGYSKKFKGFNKVLSYYLRNKKGIILANFTITTIKWTSDALIVLLVFMSFGYTINHIHIILINAIVVMISLIPISISGLGTKEITAVFLYNQIGLPAHVVLSASIITTVINYIIASTAIATK